MPRKAQYTREQIILAAYELAREGGMEAVVARAVANKLGCTTMPIFSFFAGMDELRDAVYEMAKSKCVTYLLESRTYTPAFKEFGLRWVNYAVKEPRLFPMLFSADPETLLIDFRELFVPILESIRESFGLNEEQCRELLLENIFHANGIAAFLMNRPGKFSRAEIGRRLSSVCIGLVAAMRLKDGTFREDEFREMLNANSCLPMKKYGGNHE